MNAPNDLQVSAAEGYNWSPQQDSTGPSSPTLNNHVHSHPVKIGGGQTPRAPVVPMRTPASIAATSQYIPPNDLSSPGLASTVRTADAGYRSRREPTPLGAALRATVRAEAPDIEQTTGSSNGIAGNDESIQGWF
ncbi:hypothetical protein WHR41_08565 [Cladosporium halotolerans]|uniref:Uncharacterized protein n=1 Tax=Cladosporium halotolerans TaxID=1052096 RepID=A0AB34KFB5_9PEZI